MPGAIVATSINAAHTILYVATDPANGQDGGVYAYILSPGNTDPVTGTGTVNTIWDETAAFTKSSGETISDLTVDSNGQYYVTINGATNQANDGVYVGNITDNNVAPTLVLSVPSTSDGAVQGLSVDVAPVLSGVSSLGTPAIQGGAGVHLLASAPTITGTGNLASATITITNAQAGDVLSAATYAGIQSTYDSTTHTLTLYGTDTYSDYAYDLTQVTFQDTGSDTTTSGTNPPRTLAISVSDGEASSTVSDVSVTIDRPPTVVAETGTVSEGQTLTGAAGAAVAGDTNLDGAGAGPETVTKVNGIAGDVGVPFQGTYGELTLNADGSYSYVADQTAAINGFSGTPVDTFNFTVTNAEGASASDTLKFTIDKPPQVVAETQSLAPNGATSGTAGIAGTGALAGDSDPAGGTLTVSAVGTSVGGETGGNLGNDVPGKYGDFFLNSNGSYNYYADNTGGAPAHGTDTFYFAVKDTGGAVSQSTITFTLDNPPVATADTNTAIQGGGAVTGNVVSNDTDADGDTLTVTAVSDVTNSTKGTVGSVLHGAYGDLTLNASGAYTYTVGATVGEASALTALGATVGAPTEQFSYTESDGYGGTATTTLTITVDRAPVVTAQTESVTEGASNSAGNLVTGDTDPDNNGSNSDLTITGVTPNGGALGAANTPLTGAYGTLTYQTDGAYTYAASNTAAIDAAATGSHPTDTFTVAVTNAEGVTANETLTVTVDRAPVVQAESTGILGGATVNGTAGTAGTGALAGDSDPDGGALTVTAVGSSVGTESSGNVGGSFTGAFGDLTMNADGSYSYVANNAGGAPSHATDTYYFAVTDSAGVTTQSSVTFTLDHAPVAVADNDTAYQGAANATGNVLANDTDADGDTLMVTGFTDANTAAVGTLGTVLHGQYGDLTLAADGTYTYVAGATAGERSDLAALGNSVGSPAVEIFNYSESDGHGGTSTSTLTVEVDRAPVVVSQTASLVEGPGNDVSSTLTAGDTDPDNNGSGADLTITGVTPAGGALGAANTTIDGKYGTLTYQTDGDYTYTVGSSAVIDAAPAGSHPTDTFTVAVTNAEGATANETFTVTLDRNPVTSGVIDISGTSGTPETGSAGALFSHASDRDGDPLTVTAEIGGDLAGAVGSFVNGTYGTAEVLADGSYSYEAGFNATERGNIAAAPTGSHPTDSVVLVLTDGQGGHVNQTVDFLVDRAPVAVNDSHSVNENSTLNVTAVTGVLANDSDPDGDPITDTIIANASHGTVTLNANGSFTYVPLAGYTGPDSFTYKDSDGTLNSGTATVSLTVKNPAPVPVADNGTAAVGTTTNVPAGSGVLSNDTDPNSYPLTVIGVSDVANGAGAVGSSLAGVYGSLTLNADGSYSYTPGATPTELTNLAGAPSGHLTDVFTYTEEDTAGGMASSTLTITLDRLPVGHAESAIVATGGTVTGTAGPGGSGALAGDTDLDGDALTVSALSGGTVGVAYSGTYGILTLNANGSYSYVANNPVVIAGAPAGSHPTDTFNFTVSDGHGGTVNETLSIAIDRPPVVVGAANSVFAGATLSATARTNGTGALAGDSDPDGDALTVTALVGGTVGVAHAGTYGILTLNANGAYVYVANNAAAIAAAPAGSHPVDTFSYTVSDGHGLTTTETLAITLDRAPVGVAESATLAAGGTTSGTAGTAGTGALAGDSDPDGDALHVSAVTGGTVGTALAGTYGSLTLNADGSYSYAANNAAALATAPAGSDPTDSFTFTVSDAAGDTVAETLTFTVDRAPVTVAESRALLAGATVTGTAGIAGTGALAGDSDPDGGTLKVVAVSGGLVGSSDAGTYGHLTLAANGSYSYVADNAPAIAAAATGSAPVDTYTVTVQNSEGVTSTETLSFTLDRAPTAMNDTGATNASSTAAGNVLTNDVDKDGHALTVTQVQGSAGDVGTTIAGTYGNLTLGANGAYSYTAGATLGEASAIAAAPTGSHPTDSFTYTESDGHGGASQATLSIAVDRAPIDVNDSYSAIQNIALSVNAAQGVLANDSDPDGDALSATLVSGPSHGVVTLNANGSFTYTPTAGYSGSDSFTYNDSDGTLTGTTATVNLTVSNITPTANPDTASAVVGTATSVNAAGGVLANDTDPGALALSVTGVSDTAHGAGTVGTALSGLYGDLILNADGSYTYTPGATVGEQSNLASAGAGHLTDVFTYTAHDTGTGSASSTLTITLDRLPVGVAETNTLAAGAGATGTAGIAGTGALAGDSDPDGDALTITRAGLTSGSQSVGNVGTALAGTYGTLTLQASGAYSYIASNATAIAAAPAGSAPVDTFDFTVSDGHGGTVTETLSFTVHRAPLGTTEHATLLAGATATGTAGIAGTGALAGDSDPDGGALTVTKAGVSVGGQTAANVGAIMTGTYGTLTLNANGAYSYGASNAAAIAAAPAGSTPTDTFDFTVADTNGGTVAESLTFTIERAPITVGGSKALVAGGTVTGTAGVAGTGALAGDSNPDGGSLTVVGVSGGTVGASDAGTYGHLTVAANGSYSYVADLPLAIAAAPAGSAPVDTYTVTVQNGEGVTSTETLSFTLDRAPTAVNDTASTNASNTAAGNVLGNDTDADGHALTVTQVQGSAGNVGTTIVGTYGNLTLGANGAYSYAAGATGGEAAALAAAPAGSHPTDSFTYTESDGHGGTAQASLTITVDRAPVGVNDSYAASQNTALTVAAGSGVLANDSDPDGDAISAVLVAGPSHGSLALNANGSFTYTPTAGYSGADSFTYKDSDGTLSGATATVNLNISALNPAATPDTGSAVVGNTTSVAAGAGVLANDTDPNSLALRVTEFSDTANGPQKTGGALSGLYGDLVLNTDGSYTYTPGATLAEQSNLASAGPGHLTDVFTYTEYDTGSGTASSTLTITLDRLPVGVAETGTLLSGATATGSALTGDSDPDGDSLTITQAGLGSGSQSAGNVGTALAGAYGTLTLQANGAYSYVAGNAAAIAAAPTGAAPTDTFDFTVSDGHGGAVTETVTFTIERAPITVAEAAAVVAGGTVAGTAGIGGTGALAGDSDPDGGALTVVAVSGGMVGSSDAGTYGHLTLNANGSYSYAADLPLAIAAAPAGTAPVDTYTVTVQNGEGVTSTETLTFTLDRAPTAVNDAASTNASSAAVGNVLSNDLDSDGHTLTVTQVQGSAGDVGITIAGTYGQLTLANNGAYSYVAGAIPGEAAALAAAPAGSHPTDSFTYAESDGHGGTSQATLTVTVDRAPIGVNDSYSASQNGTLTVAAGAGVLANDSDPDGDAISAILVSGPSHGALTLNANGSFTYTPTAGYSGADSFTYKDSDGTLSGTTATVNLNVNHLNPTANPDTATAVVGTTTSVGAASGVLANDTDPNSLALSVSGVSDTAHGAGSVGAVLSGLYGDLVLNADGSYTYTPGATVAEQTNLANGAAGHLTDVFTYTEHDTSGVASASSTLTITLDRLPVVVAEAKALVAGGAVSGTAGIAGTGVLAGDSDPDGGTLTVSNPGVYTGTYGSLTLNANGSYSYVASNAAAIAAAVPGSHPTDSFNITVSDGLGATTEALTFSIDRAPTGVAEATTVASGGTVTGTAGIAGTGALAGDSDLDGDALTVANPGSYTGTYGSLTLNANGAYSYVANNALAIAAAPANSAATDSFNVTVSDGHGGTTSETLAIVVDRSPVITGTVAGQTDDDKHTVNPFSTVTVSAPNGPTQVETVRVTLDSAAKGSFTAGSLIASGFVANGSAPGEYDFVGAAAQVTAALRELSYAPTAHDVAPGQVETTNFTISVSDGVSPAAVNTTASVATTDLNDAPTATPITGSLQELHILTGNLLAGAGDVDHGDSVSLTGVAVGAGAASAVGPSGLAIVGAYGTLTVQQNGAYSYQETNDTLGVGATGTDNFTFTVSDTHGASTTSTLTLTIVSTSTGGGSGTIVDGGSNNHLLIGGQGNTTFFYDSVSESTVSHPDRITNFDPSKGDIIDLSHVDAVTSTPALDHFTVVNSFDGHAGELVIQSADATGLWHIYGDTTGSGTANFEITFHLIGQWEPASVHLV